jgi:hypothetical protein
MLPVESEGNVSSTQPALVGVIVPVHDAPETLLQTEFARKLERLPADAVSVPAREEIKKLIAPDPVRARSRSTCSSPLP